jgi:hypothetical protein
MGATVFAGTRVPLGTMLETARQRAEDAAATA